MGTSNRDCGALRQYAGGAVLDMDVRPLFTKAENDQRGVSTVEFALLLIPFLLLVFGVADFGLGIWAYNNLSQSVQQGAREAIVRGAGSPLGGPGDEGNNGARTCADSLPLASIAAQVCTHAHPLNPGNFTVTIDWDCPFQQCGVTRTVTVAGRYLFEPILSDVFHFPSINLRSEARMRLACCLQQ